MRLKIVSDGTRKGTHVVDAKTGEELQDITDLQWNIKADSYMSRAVITILRPTVDVTGEAEDEDVTN